MLICSDISVLRQTVQAWKSAGDRIAFVPTMGNLHAGHLQLVRAAWAQSNRVVVSIFVNPLQFNEAADFHAYPRTLDEDGQLLCAVNTDLLFTPDVQQMYPQGQISNTKVIVPGLSELLEGEHRPGHFTGVTTVVAKFFNMVQADTAWFGEKDFQQLMLIRRMVADLDLPIQIHSLPTVRETDGLAMSSRNGRLSADERRLAPHIYQILCTLRDQILQGKQSYALLEQQAMVALDQAGFKAEYVAVRRQADLLPPVAGEGSLVLLLAAWLGKTRLIDNLTVNLYP